MTYKEIQVPSQVAKVIYLKALEGFLEIEKECEKIAAERAILWENFNDEEHKKFQKWAEGKDYHQYSNHPYYIDRWDWIMDDLRWNPVPSCLDEIRTCLQACELSENLVMTPEQVETMKSFEKEVGLKASIEWMKKPLELVSKFPELPEPVQKIVEVPVPKPQTPAPVAVTAPVGSTALGWAVFAGIMAVVLFLIFA